jgi:hypothetical protein
VKNRAQSHASVILPGDKAVLFTAHTSPLAGFDDETIEVFAFADHRRKTLVHGGKYARYFPSGHLVYASRGRLFAVSFDLDRLEVRGTPAVVVEALNSSGLSGSAQFDFTPAGTLIYRPAVAGARARDHKVAGPHEARSADPAKTRAISLPGDVAGQPRVAFVQVEESNRGSGHMTAKETPLRASVSIPAYTLTYFGVPMGVTFCFSKAASTGFARMAEARRSL